MKRPPGDVPAYFMRYMTSARGANQDSVLLILFPPTFGTTREFITVLVVETCGGAACTAPAVNP